MPVMRRRFLQQLAALGLASAGPAWAAFEVSLWPARQSAPRLAATDLDGKTWRLSELRGRAVLLNFWASWCEPCRAEMPTLQQLAEIYGPAKLVVLTITYKEPAAKAASFAQSTGLNLPVLLDPAGEVTHQWGAQVFPTTILIGADGRPRQRVRGELDWTSREAERLIAPLLPPLSRR